MCEREQEPMGLRRGGGRYMKIMQTHVLPLLGGDLEVIILLVNYFIF